MIKSHVAIIKCTSYDENIVLKAVKNGIDILGGVNLFVKPNEKIILKPNILVGVPSENAATTHPAVLNAAITIFKAHGCLLEVGDSPGFGNPKDAAKKCGLMEIIERHNIPFADFEKGEIVTLEKELFKKRFPIAKSVINADGLISLPKFKSHGLTRFTGAVKNQYGCVPGMNKAKFHAEIPVITDFASFIVDINSYIKPRLFIMDAIIAMEGNGPNSGDATPMNCIIISSDPVALDATCCRMINCKPEFVPTTLSGYRAGLGTYIKNDIEILGSQISEFANPDFSIVRLPAINVGRNPLTKYLRSRLIPRPEIMDTSCIKCGRCIDICPVVPKAINWSHNTKKKPPVYTYSRCIRCFCCHETCPAKAIYIKKSPFGFILAFITLGSILLGGIRMVVRNMLKQISGKNDKIK